MPNTTNRWKLALTTLEEKSEDEGTALSPYGWLPPEGSSDNEYPPLTDEQIFKCQVILWCIIALTILLSVGYAIYGSITDTKEPPAASYNGTCDDDYGYYCDDNEAEEQGLLRGVNTTQMPFMSTLAAVATDACDWINRLFS